MILYLRNEKGKTIFEVEIWVKTEDDNYSYVELSTNFDIQNYSKLLISKMDNQYFRERKLTKIIGKQKPTEIEEFISIFDQLSELRGWMWESYFMVKRNTKENTKENLTDVIKEVKIILNAVADKYDLFVIED